MGLKVLSPWFLHGLSMVPPSKTPKSMDKPWRNHGGTMDKPWTNHGQTMDEPWTNPLFDLWESIQISYVNKLMTIHPFYLYKIRGTS
ncbi:MAG: hypothetical protein N4A37_07635 [Prolixibacteraceae bacterium]|nr:hypothetical protein [Prolixibacteraceae bacterium]